MDCDAFLVAAVLVLAGQVAAGQARREPPAPRADRPGKLAFRPAEKGQYAFDTGVLRGVLRPGGKAIGLSSVTHAASGVRLDGPFGLLSCYRVFTTHARYGHAAWDWPGTAKLLPDGAVAVRWPAATGRPFDLAAVYRWASASAIDVAITVHAAEGLPHFEVFLASYFHKDFPQASVYVGRSGDAKGKGGLLTAKRSFGHWQMFPRDRDVLAIIRDGRWQRKPNPVQWAILPELAAPLAARRHKRTRLTAVLMAPSRDGFAVACPYSGESHSSLYVSLFGGDVKAGRSATARARLAVLRDPTDQQVIDLYRPYAKAAGARRRRPRPEPAPGGGAG